MSKASVEALKPKQIEKPSQFGRTIAGIVLSLSALTACSSEPAVNAVPAPQETTISTPSSESTIVSSPESTPSSEFPVPLPNRLDGIENWTFDQMQARCPIPSTHPNLQTAKEIALQFQYDLTRLLNVFPEEELNKYNENGDGIIPEEVQRFAEKQGAEITDGCLEPLFGDGKNHGISSALDFQLKASALGVILDGAMDGKKYKNFKFYSKVIGMKVNDNNSDSGSVVLTTEHSSNIGETCVKDVNNFNPNNPLFKYNWEDEETYTMAIHYVKNEATGSYAFELKES